MSQNNQYEDSTMISNEQYRTAISELKTILDDIYRYFGGTVNLPLTEETKFCLEYVPEKVCESTRGDKKTVDTVSSFLSGVSKNSFQQLIKDDQFGRSEDIKANSSSQDEKDAIIAKLRQQIKDQQQDIEELEDELKECQVQILQLKEEKQMSQIKKYTNASSIAGLSSRNSLVNKGERESLSERVNSIYFPNRDPKHKVGGFENTQEDRDEFESFVNVLKKEGGELIFLDSPSRITRKKDLIHRPSKDAVAAEAIGSFGEKMTLSNNRGNTDEFKLPQSNQGKYSNFNSSFHNILGNNFTKFRGLRGETTSENSLQRKPSNVSSDGSIENAKAGETKNADKVSKQSPLSGSMGKSESTTIPERGFTSKKHNATNKPPVTIRDKINQFRIKQK
ncbi:hypothetical protein AX774_g5353 [Zancudomyces culisetae]|uniref:Uncharacterized protein n=1 Tax=Zancudomyces culisetae TaxID=1213189 RepID=A0A1R1PJQ5_ZANCU|nr:hypothetical protein AX774_g5353 [Zancudomyces culisetae]|eukprot:OMH81198.1 hypothetical protein AX774_g5353 [Zancudomyces culisetae]